MKNLICILALGLLGSVAAVERVDGSVPLSPGVLFRHHFVGGQALGQTTNATKFKEVWALPGTKPALEETLNRLARAPYRFWKEGTPLGAGDQATFLRPLLDDVLVSESFSEITGSTNQPAFTFGIRLPDEQARLWQTNLWQLTSGGRSGKPVPAMLDRHPGWDQSIGTGGVRLVRAEGWVVVATGPNRSNNLMKAVARLVQKQRLRPEGLEGWLTLEADLPRLGTWLPLFRLWPLAPVRMAMVGEGENLRTRGSVQFAQPITWKFEPWKIPTNSIDENFISFTVAQGVASVFKNSPWVKSLGLPQIPNQFTMWGVPAMLSQTVFAAPVADATNAIRSMAGTVPKLMESLVGGQMGTILYASNSATILWQGFPAISPHIRPWKEAGQEYLMAALFPLAPRTNYPPQELLAQLGSRKDIAYYDWELTEPRIVQARQIFTLHALIHNRRTPAPELPLEKWLYDISPVVGNAVTELTVASPKELTLLRKSHLGLTGFELVALIRWIGSPGFPLTFELPPPVDRPAAAQKP